MWIIFGFVLYNISYVAHIPNCVVRYLSAMWVFISYVFTRCLVLVVFALNSAALANIGRNTVVYILNLFFILHVLYLWFRSNKLGLQSKNKKSTNFLVDTKYDFRSKLSLGIYIYVFILYLPRILTLALLNWFLISSYKFLSL